jgi:hypothetical protein
MPAKKPKLSAKTKIARLAASQSKQNARISESAREWAKRR